MNKYIKNINQSIVYLLMFSKLLDISGFFLIVVINLSLIALLCYYAKKKFESIEEIQREQSKVLFDLVNKSTSSNSGIDPMFLSVSLNDSPQAVTPSVQEENKIISYDMDENSMISGENVSNKNVVGLMSVDHDDGDSESEDESDSEDEDEEDSESESETENNTETHVKKITTVSLDLNDDEEEDDNDVEEEAVESLHGESSNEEEHESVDLDKMTISELKQYIDSKGGKLNSKTTKKNDILEYIKSNSL